MEGVQRGAQMKFEFSIAAVVAAAMVCGAANADVPELPAKPLFGSVGVVGPGTALQVLASPSDIGVTNLTLVNYDRVPHRLRVFAGSWTQTAAASAAGAGPSCASGGGGGPDLEFIVAADATLVIPYPTPLVFRAAGGATCIFAQVTTVTQTGNVRVMATGFAP